MPEQSVTPVGPANGEVVPAKPHEKLMEFLARRAEVDGVNRSFEVASMQVDKILSATTDQEIWDADEKGTSNGQDMTDVELLVQEVKYAKTSEEYDADLGVYAIISAIRLDTGEEVVIATGAALVIAKLRAMEARGKFPLECVIRGTKAGNGTVLKLRPLAKRVVAAGAPAEQ